MKLFLILVNLFFATPQILRLLVLRQLLDFVGVFNRRRTIANGMQVAQVFLRDLFFRPYMPSKFALRFARKADIPSFCAGVPKAAWKKRRS